MDQEPEPEYEWVSDDSTLPMEIKYERGMQWYRFYPTARWSPLDDDVFTLYGWKKAETKESRIARLEWRVRQLELERDRYQDWLQEMDGRD